jgi:diketogulonate reductase-like aldo/keto reductase
MKKHGFGSSAALVPVIGQGSWNFPSGKTPIEQTKLALKAGIEQGMVHLDTAEMYGQSEDIIGEVIKDLPRADLFIVSKVLPSNASFEGTIKACERSLKRLGTDYLDCYLLHWRGSIALAETMLALEKLVDDGKIRSLGVSNFDVDDMIEAESLLKKHKIACNQVLYHLYERGIERQVLPHCKSRNIAVVGYTPFGQRKTPGASTKSGAVLHKVAADHKATPEEIILAFLVRLDNLFTIPKASQITHTLQNARAGDIKLSAEEIALIDAEFPAPRTDRPLATG